MLRSLSGLYEFTVQANNGEVGFTAGHNAHSHVIARRTPQADDVVICTCGRQQDQAFGALMTSGNHRGGQARYNRSSQHIASAPPTRLSRMLQWE